MAFARACLLAALSATVAAAEPDPSPRFLLEARIFELLPGGGEREATRVTQEIGPEELGNVYAWWGRRDGAGGPIEAVAESVAGEHPRLGDRAWEVVWQVQSVVEPLEEQWRAQVRLARGRFDGLGSNGRPAYRRTVEQAVYGDPRGEPRRYSATDLEPAIAKRLGISRVVLEVRVTIVDLESTSQP